jgi:ABC-type dipeptide/oligopeptide/nickel transport system permease subunit
MMKSAAAAAEAVADAPVKGRSLWAIAWGRLRRDKVAMFSLVIIILLFLMAIFAPQICHFLGIDPTTNHADILDEIGFPSGPLGGAGKDHWLGLEPALGRDVLARTIYGARVSLGISLAATVIAITLGTIFGITAGFFGGWADSLISRFMDIMLAFPVLLFSIAMLVIISSMPHVSNTLRAVVLIIIIGVFGFAYPARIIRGQTISLREREFVEAATSLGASNTRILIRELLPNLAAPILVYATLIIPVNILFEASLSFLGVGLQEPIASWGSMLNEASKSFTVDPFFMFVPGMAIFITVLAFNLLGDGVRDAFDPKSTR